MSTTDKPWIVQRQHGDPLYFKTLSEARKRVEKDLRDLLDQFTRLQAKDAMTDIQVALNQVAVDIGLSGGSMDVSVDPYTNTRYRVTVTKRASNW
jgi:CRISPR/Cas system type I-B associated protein Csh2 (Cas7 group RAMP superfamily)